MVLPAPHKMGSILALALGKVENKRLPTGYLDQMAEDILKQYQAGNSTNRIAAAIREASGRTCSPKAIADCLRRNFPGIDDRVLYNGRMNVLD